MSKQATPKKQRGRPTKQVTKVRQNIVLNPGVRTKAMKAAFNDGLSLSTWIEQLIRERLA
jgi:predicted HicB family RNase H-like nuclease